MRYSSHSARFGVHIVTEDVVAKRLADDVVGLELVECLPERAGQLTDALLGDPGGVHLEQGFLDRVREGQTMLDPIEAGRDHRREREIRVRRRIGAAHLARVPSIDFPGETIGTRISADRLVRPQVR